MPHNAFENYTFEEIKELVAEDPEFALQYALHVKNTKPVMFWATVFRYYREHLDRSALGAYGIDTFDDLQREWAA